MGTTQSLVLISVKISHRPSWYLQPRNKTLALTNVKHVKYMEILMGIIISISIVKKVAISIKTWNYFLNS